MVLEGAQLEMSSVLEQLSQARGEVETLRTVATLSESSRQEAVDQVRSQWQEEVASLQAIMKGNAAPPVTPRRNSAAADFLLPVTRNRVRVRGPVPPAPGAGAGPVEPVPGGRGAGAGRAAAPPRRGPGGGEPGGRHEESRTLTS